MYLLIYCLVKLQEIIKFKIPLEFLKYLMSIKTDIRKIKLI